MRKMNKIDPGLILITMILFSAACLSSSPEKSCPEFDAGNTRAATVFGEINTGKELQLITPDNQSYRICGEHTGTIREQKTGYLFAGGRLASPAAGNDNSWFQVDQILLFTAGPDPDWSGARRVVLTGLLERGRDNRITIVTNWKSRSRVSHYILGSCQALLAEDAGKYAKLSCYIINAQDDPNPWAGEVVVEEVMLISTEPIIE